MKYNIIFMIKFIFIIEGFWGFGGSGHKTDGYQTYPTNLSGNSKDQYRYQLTDVC